MRLRPFSNRSRAWRVLVSAPLLVVVLLVSGCTSRFIYNRLDTLASWYFESLVALNDGQRTELRTWLENTLAWHRRSELTRYAAFLSDLSASAAQPGDHNSYDAVRKRFEGLVSDLAEKTAPEASQLLVTLSPQQIDELVDNLAEKTRESTEENAEAVAEHEWHPNQIKSVTRQVKRWTGSVTPAQKQIVATVVNELEPTYLEWAESQDAWRNALRDALLTRDTQSEGGPPQRVLELLREPDHAWTEAYSQKVARNRERYLRLFGELDVSLTAQQRDHLRNELTKLAQQLHNLAQD